MTDGIATTDLAIVVRRIARLEKFITDHAEMWDSLDAMLDNSTLTETITDTLKSKVYVQSTATLMIDD